MLSEKICHKKMRNLVISSTEFTCKYHSIPSELSTASCEHSTKHQKKIRAREQKTSLSYKNPVQHALHVYLVLGLRSKIKF